MLPAAVAHLPRNAPVARNHELGIPRRPRVECPPINPYATVRGADVPDAPDSPSREHRTVTLDVEITNPAPNASVAPLPSGNVRNVRFG